jgi:hypothetical protein
MFVTEALCGLYSVTFLYSFSATFLAKGCLAAGV